MLNCLGRCKFSNFPPARCRDIFFESHCEQRDIMIDYGYWCEILILWQKSERWETFGLARGFKRERAEQIRARNKDLGWFVSMSSRVWIDVIASARARERARKRIFFITFFSHQAPVKKRFLFFPKKIFHFLLKMPTFHRNFKKSCPIFWTFPHF